MTAESGSPPQLVGERVSRKEDHRLVTGSGVFVADLSLPSMLDVAFLRSSEAHALIRSVDVQSALDHSGVHHVVTADDLEDVVKPFSRFVDQEHTPPGLEAAIHPVVKACDMEVLASDRVRHVGQAVAAVVADDRYLAEDAVELIDVDYEALPVVLDPELAVAKGAPLLHSSVSDNVQASFTVDVGDVDKVLRDAPHTLSLKVRTPRQAGSPIETRGVVASYDEVSEELTVWSSTQTPYMVRTRIAEQLGMAEQQIRVIAPDVGGGFGPKAQVYPEEIVVAYLAIDLGRPIRWIEDRRENLVAMAQSRDQVHWVEVGFDDQGVISALSDRFLMDSGAYNPFSITCAYNTAAHLRSVFQVPHYRCHGQCVLTNKTPNVPYRGAGRPEAAFAMDRTINAVARYLDEDPADILRRNLIPADQMPYPRGMPYRDGVEIVYDCGDFPAAFEQVLELVDYRSHRSEQAMLREQNIWRGIGFGTYVEGTGIGPFESGLVRLDSQGRIVVNAGSAPHGQSHDTTLSQVVADQFQVDIGAIKFRAGDTSLLPYGVGTFASRSAVNAGSAVLVAAQTLKQKILGVAAEVLEVSSDDLDMDHGEVFVRGVAQSRLSFRDIYVAASPGPMARLPAGAEPGTSERHYFVPPTVTFGAGFQAAVVEVDIETGFVEIKQMVVVHDCGRLINPLIVEGQIDGGVVQGIGAALFEELVYDEIGQPQTTTLMDYLLPTMAETPEIVQVHLDFVSDRNPLGVKGVGEAGVISPPSAIAGAVEDALKPLDLEIYQIPLSPSTLLHLINEASNP